VFAQTLWDRQDRHEGRSFLPLTSNLRIRGMDRSKSAIRRRMSTETTKVKRDRYRLEIKVSEEQKGLIARGAAAAGKGISEFVRSAAEKAATEALKAK
jgi:uncharacterized protein (DUF1778 family)